MMSEEAVKKRKWYSLYDKVYAPRNLERAWEKVRSNKGTGGIDRQSITDFEKGKDQHLRELHRLLKENRYKPLSLRRVYIPKGIGEKRPLGIPAIRDRVVQQALLNILEPIFEPTFHEHSYGFRPNRGTHTALGHVVISMQKGKEWVLEIDIRKYFDTVDHELLLDAVNEEISDWEPPPADPHVLEIARHGRGCGMDGDRGRNTAGRSDQSTVGQHLSQSF